MLRTTPVCADIVGSGGAIAARTGTAPALPIPVVQNCGSEGALLAAILLTGCVAATLAWRALFAAGPSQRLCAVLYAGAAAIALTFPYISTTDAYAYAMYGYEAGVIQVTPYRPAELHEARDAQYRRLGRLFPDPRSGIRIANYGPLFVAVYAAIARAADGSLGTAIVMQRALCAVALLAAALLLDRFAFVALAPFMIFELIAFAHADAIVVALLAAAWSFYRRARIGLCAVAIVAAGEVKAVALLALAALAIELFHRGDRAVLLRAVAWTAAAFALSAILAYAFLGTFSLGGAPAIAPFSSPAMLLAALAGGSVPAIKLFAAIQLVAGLVLAGRFFLLRRYDAGAATATAALPALFPWYFSWLLPLGALTKDARFASAMVAVAFVAILGEANLMTFEGGLPLAAAILAVTYGAPLLAYRATFPAGG